MSKLQSECQIRQANPPHLGFFVLLEEKQLAFLLGGGYPYYLPLASHVDCTVKVRFSSFYGGGYVTFDASG
ncbi:Phospho-N-acetylmuramoyl-pentapeptide-transferase-like protein [Zea mays]|uniref:Phospho-N-acetylmuramoyl-pentapeptide-transferase-like protein n=1 Tax=Zea mays TaxID=4577 RepID=A0A1D6MG31_MAIZE|nr:Phospho-N-acetylmuramoyl-pentapeptide-transferase-like protein [Zea mays]ONM28536.1 Phospho-N-acetylmuramoyl-pentapeptide-transferase-like protein [Zea mays]